MFVSCKYMLVCFLHFIGVIIALKLLSFVTPSFLICLLSNLVYLGVCLFIATYTFEFTKRRFLCEKVYPNGKAIFITGCDSGFGNNLAKRLDSRGYHVFAGCLFPSGKGAQELKDHCSERLQIVPLDVTKDDSVNEAYAFVKNNLENLKLWAIVNNAGIQKGFSTDFASIRDYKDTMEVNGFGMVRTTKAFLPLLKLSKGRVVNLTSLNGRVAFPHNSPYGMSKYAASGFSDTLRLEMKVWGIRVIQVEPELFRTMLVDLNEVGKRIDSEIEQLEPEIKEEYGKKYFKNFKTATQFMITKYASTKIYKVVDDLESAISLKYPSLVYKPSRNDFIRISICLTELLPNTVKDSIMETIYFLTMFPKPLKT